MDSLNYTRFNEYVSQRIRVPSLIFTLIFVSIKTTLFNVILTLLIRLVNSLSSAVSNLSLNLLNTTVLLDGNNPLKGDKLGY